MGNYLIIQVKCFLVFNQPVTKDISKLSCTPHSNSTVALDNHKIVGHKKFNLIATINHSGNLPRGHHTSFIKYASSSSSSSWFHCNDAAVIPSNETALINDTLCLENMRKHFRSSASLPFAQQLVFFLHTFQHGFSSEQVTTDHHFGCLQRWSCLLSQDNSQSGDRGRNCCPNLLIVSYFWQRDSILGCNDPTYYHSYF